MIILNGDWAVSYFLSYIIKVPLELETQMLCLLVVTSL